MIRVLFVLPNLQGGGAERLVVDLVRLLDRCSFRPAMFLLKDEGPLRGDVPDDVPVHAASNRGRLRYRAPGVLGSLVREARRSDVVVGALELTATYLAWAAAKAAGRPMVAWVHIVLDRYLDHTSGLLARLAAGVFYRRAVELVVVPSAGVGAALRRWPGVSPSRIVEIPNFIDVDRLYRKASEPAPALDHRPPMVVALGRLEYQKGFDVLIRAHAEVRRLGVDCTLVVAGEGPQRATLQRLAASLGVADSVVLPGFLPNPYPLLRAADLFVLSSRYEGFPLVLLEALALGTPVVATDCPAGPREILDGGRWGRLVPPEDPQALARAAVEALAAGRSAGLEGVRRAAQFASGQVVPRWEALLRRMVR